MALLPIAPTHPKRAEVEVNWSVAGHLDEVTVTEVQRLLEARGLRVGMPMATMHLGKRAKEVHTILVQQQRWMSIAELTELTGAANSSVRVYLSELVARGLVDRQEDNGGVRFKAR